MLQSKRWIVVVIGSCLVLTCLTVVFVYGQLQSVPRGVYYGNWDLSGATKQQLTTEWEELERRWSNQLWALTTPEPFVRMIHMKPKKLGLAVNNASLFEQLGGLWEGPFWQRAWQRYQLSNTVIPVEIVMDRAALTKSVASTWPEIEASTPVNAIRRITPSDQVEYTTDLPAYRVDTQQLASQLTAKAESLGLPVANDVQEERYIELDVPLRMIAAETTLEALKEQKIERKIAEFTTTFASNNQGRIHNIQATADVVNDMLLGPEEVFDFSEVVAQTEKEHGFQPAPVILNGQFVPGIGGGICQISSTLYNAALVAGLTIVERQHHSLPVRYVPLGLDATFASGHINFKFRNHVRSHLLIRTETSDTQVTIKLFGSLPQEESYKVESNVVETIPPPIQYVQNKSLVAGKKQVITQGTTGYIVETVRIHYLNGQKQSSALVSKDYYRPQPTIIAIRDPDPHTKQPSEKKQPPIIEDGVFGPVF